MEEQLTIGDLRRLKKYCKGNEKLINFRGVYLEAKDIHDGVTNLLYKLQLTDMGIDIMSDSDRLLLLILEKQKGYVF